MRVKLEEKLPRAIAIVPQSCTRQTSTQEKTDQILPFALTLITVSTLTTRCLPLTYFLSSATFFTNIMGEGGRALLVINLCYKGVFHWTLSWSVRGIGYVAGYKHFCIYEFQVVLGYLLRDRGQT